MSEQRCPCCDKNCLLDKPKCKYGVQFKHTGVVAENIKSGTSKKERSIEKQLHDNLRELGHLLRTRFETNGSQSRIMALIYKNQPVTQQELIEITGITSPSMSEQLVKLENATLITRKKSDIDGRVSIIELTEEGRKQVLRYSAERKKNTQKEFQILSDNEKDDLLVLVQKLNESWKNTSC